MSEQHHLLIKFRGPPSNLSAEVSLPSTIGTLPTILIDKKSIPLIPTGDEKTISKLTLSLPNDTPPGQTSAQVVIGDSTFDARIDVQIRSVVRFEPSALELKANAGDTLAATINVTNLGNGTLDCAADGAITLRKAGTLAQSVVTAFKNSKRDFTDRLITLGDTLADAPSHELVVESHMHATTLKSGECTTVELELGVPEDIEPDTKWTGSLALLGARVRVEVDTAVSR